MDEIRARIAEVWKNESARLVGRLVRLVRDVWLGCIERRRVMPNVLSAEENAAGQRFEEHAWLYQPGDGFKPEAANRFNLSTNFSELRNAIAVEVEAAGGVDARRGDEVLERGAAVRVGELAEDAVRLVEAQDHRR